MKNLLHRLDARPCVSTRLLLALGSAAYFLLAVNLFAASFNVTNVTSFQNALTTAQGNGEDDTINVAAGTYNISTPLSFASGGNSLNVIGAGASSTILDGGRSVQVMNIDNSTAGDIFVAGLTFQNGSNNVGEVTVGGGLSLVCNDSCSATVASCVFSNNFVGYGGGGAFVGVNNGSATVTNCVATQNSTAIDDAGGLSVYKETGNQDIFVANNIFYDNHLHTNAGGAGDVEGSGFYIYYLGTYCNIIVSNNLTYGNTLEDGAGALYIRMTQGGNLTIIDNTFSNNIAGTRGGGIGIELETGAMRIQRNQFINNSAFRSFSEGGGVEITFNTSGTLEINDNVFAGNSVNGQGGGAFMYLGNGVTPVIAQNIFVDNRAGDGGGLKVNSDCNVDLINNTFFGNVSSDSDAGGFGFYSDAAGVSADIFNEIYRTNLPDSVAAVGTRPIAAQYSNIEGGSGQGYFGTGCIDSDPLFLNPALPAGADGIYATSDDGLQLIESSPSVDTGITSAVPVGITHDLIGNPRIVGGTVDMGCYEFIPEPGIIMIMSLLVISALRRGIWLLRNRH